MSTAKQFEKPPGPSIPEDTPGILLSAQDFANLLPLAAADPTLQHALVQQYEHLQRQAFSDSLTGLSNKNFWNEEMRRLAKASRLGIVIVSLDLDWLRLTNNLLLHQSGDALLREAADFLQDTFRPEDVIARIGGDEFYVAITMSVDEVFRIYAEYSHKFRSDPNADPNQLLSLPEFFAQSIEKRVTQALPKFNQKLPADSIPLSLSVGAALSLPDESRPVSPHDLALTTESADSRMYKMKNQHHQQGLTG